MAIPQKLQPLPPPTFKVSNILGTSKTYRTLADYCHDHPKSPRCLNPQSQIVIPGTGLNLLATWRFAHPHPDALAGINLAALRQSTTAQKLLTAISTAMHVDLSQYSGSLNQLGQLDQVWLSLSGNDPLFLLQGQLRIPEGFFSLGNGMTLWRISKTAVLRGHEQSVRDAVERLSSPASTTPATGVLAPGSTALNDFWMTGTPKLLASQAGVVPMSKDMTSYSATLSLRSGLQASVKLILLTPPPRST